MLTASLGTFTTENGTTLFSRNHLGYLGKLEPLSSHSEMYSNILSVATF